ncbi:MAG: hypothetical protein VW715_15265 [Rhodospirillales bacterium]
MEEELQKILRDIGKDISALRKGLVGTTKSILDNAKVTKSHTATQKLLIAQQEAQRKLLKDHNLLTDEQNKQIDQNIDAIKKSTMENAKAGKGVMSFTGMVFKAVKFLGKLVLGAAEIGANFGKTSSNIKSFNDAVEAGFDNIPYLGAALKKLAPELDDNVQLFKGLAQSGASFGSSITRLRMIAYDAGMPLLQFQELIQNNSTTLARLFGSVDDGIPQIAGLGRALRRFTEQELAQFGITMDETNEFLTTFAEIERARGRAGQLSQAQLLEGTKEYAKNLVLLSKLTGESVTELDKRNRQLAADGVFQAKLAQMDEEQAERVRQALNLLPASAQQAAKEIIGLGVPIGDAGRGLEVLSGGQFGETLKALMEGTEVDLLEVSNVFKTIGTDIIRSGDAAASAALAGNPLFAEVLNIATQLAGVAADRESVEGQIIAAQRDNIVAAVNMTSALDRNTFELQRLGTTLLDEGIFGRDSKVGNMLDEFVMGDPTKYTEKFVDSVIGLIKGDGKKRATAKDLDDMLMIDGKVPGLDEFRTGTNGFRNFGAGTPVVLHGTEAVVPKNDIGQLAGLLSEVGATTATPTGDTITNNTNVDMTALTTSTRELVDLNKKVAQHLNTLVTIGAMTEKNTKNFNNRLANMGGSLV